MKDKSEGLAKHAFMRFQASITMLSLIAATILGSTGVYAQ